MSDSPFNSTSKPDVDLSGVYGSSGRRVHQCSLPVIGTGIQMVRPPWECGLCGALYQMQSYGAGGWWIQVRGPQREAQT